MPISVSVLIPSYNHSAYIASTIQSVLNQSFSDFELLIRDDCSTDNSSEIISGFSDSRIRAFLSEKNVGVVRSLNFLMEQAKGKYLAILGSDDLRMPEKLEKQVAFLESHPDIDCCFSWA